MKILKAGVIIAETFNFDESAFNSVYSSECNDIGCVCDDCVDGG